MNRGGCDMQSVFFGFLWQRAFFSQDLGQGHRVRRDRQKPDLFEKELPVISLLAITAPCFMNDQGRCREVELMAMMGPPFKSRLLMTGNDQVITQRRGKIADYACFEIDRWFQMRASFSVIGLTSKRSTTGQWYRHKPSMFDRLIRKHVYRVER